MLKLHSNNFNAWLSGRIRAASQGMILDHQTGDRVEVATAKNSIFLEHTRRRAEYNRKEQALSIEQKALDQAKADPNDPWAFARTKAHLQNGLCELEDYSVDFNRVTVDLYDFSGEVIGRKMADVPMRIRRA